MGQNLLQGLNELFYRSIYVVMHWRNIRFTDIFMEFMKLLYQFMIYDWNYAVHCIDYTFVMVKGNILMIFVFYSCKLSVAKDLKTFERYLTTDLKHPRSIPHRLLWKALKEIFMAIDVMLLFVGILLELLSHRIPYGVIA